jgi:hypothetical protein
MMAKLKRVIQTRFPYLYQLARRVTMASSFRYRYHRRPDSLVVATGYTRGSTSDDTRLIDRLTASYRVRAEAPTGMWSDFFRDLHGDIHDAFLSNDRARIETILRNPVTSDLLYGFDFTARTFRRGGKRIEDIHDPALTLDGLVCLAEAIGARPTENPERYTWRCPKTRAHEVIAQIEAAINFPIAIPNPFPAEYGLVCDGGVMSYRAPQSIYQAWRIAKLVKGISNPRVLEIGGGLGRTAYYARHFGITDYTIIDIPVSSLAQGYFLGRVAGDDAVELYGEPASADSTSRIKLLAPRSFFEGKGNYDLIVNIDSLTEIGVTAARQYWDAIQGRTKTFLSINHEANEFTVLDLIRESGHVARSSRMPYGMRRGYVEETVDFVDHPRGG